jgi:uncharacterized membrane protein
LILAAVVDTDALWQLIIYALVASVGVTAIFSFGIVGLTRFDEARRGGRGGSGIGYAVLAAVCSLVVIAVVIEAIVIMTRK